MRGGISLEAKGAVLRRQRRERTALGTTGVAVRKNTRGGGGKRTRNVREDSTRTR